MTTPRPSLTLTLLQAREATMAFFRPALNAHDLTEQQWRVIRILRQQGELESHQLAELACILKPSMSGVLKRLERDGVVARRKSPEDQRRVFITLTDKGRTVQSVVDALQTPPLERAEWIAFDAATLSLRLAHLPPGDATPFAFEAQKVVEFYALRV